MKLGKKTFIYTLCMSSLLGLSLLLFMVIFLPGLYMNTRSEKILDKAKSLHQAYVSSQDGQMKLDKPYSWFGIKANQSMDEISINVRGTQIKFHFPEGEFKSQFKDLLNQDFHNNPNHSFKEIENLFQQVQSLDMFKDLNIEVIKDKNTEWKPTYENNTVAIGDSAIMFEASFQNQEGNRYSSYVGLSRGDDGYYVTMYSEVSPSIDDIKPVLFMMIPVYLCIILIVGVVGSGIFSRMLTKPVQNLLEDAYQRKLSTQALEPIPITSKDEIGELTQLLNELYQIKEDQFRNLKEENERKEIFMKSFWHKLKNPVASCMLLTDGMREQVGKYQDRDTYLQVLKGELRKIEGLIEKVSELNQNNKQIELSIVNVEEQLEDLLNNFNVEIKEKSLELLLSGRAQIETDIELFGQILENLIENAIHYTKEKGCIQISCEDNKLIIQNKPTFVQSELVESLLEPLVSSQERENSWGLGLYFVKTFCKQLDINLDYTYEKETFSVQLDWKSK